MSSDLELNNLQQRHIVTCLELAKTTDFPVKVRIAQSPKQSIRFMFKGSDGVNGLKSKIDEHLSFYGKTHFNNLGWYDNDNDFMCLVTDYDVLEFFRWCIATSRLRADLQIHAYDENQESLPPPYTNMSNETITIYSYIIMVITTPSFIAVSILLVTFYIRHF